MTNDYKAVKNRANDDKMDADAGSNARMITDKTIGKLKTLEAKIREQEDILQYLVDKLKDSDYNEEEGRYVVSFKK